MNMKETGASCKRGLFFQKIAYRTLLIDDRFHTPLGRMVDLHAPIFANFFGTFSKTPITVDIHF